MLHVRAAGRRGRHVSAPQHGLLHHPGQRGATLVQPVEVDLRRRVVAPAQRPHRLAGALGREVAQRAHHLGPLAGGVQREEIGHAVVERRLAAADDVLHREAPRRRDLVHDVGGEGVPRQVEDPDAPLGGRCSRCFPRRRRRSRRTHPGPPSRRRRHRAHLSSHRASGREWRVIEVGDGGVSTSHRARTLATCTRSSPEQPEGAIHGDRDLGRGACGCWRCLVPRESCIDGAPAQQARCPLGCVSRRDQGAV